MTPIDVAVTPLIYADEQESLRNALVKMMVHKVGSIVVLRDRTVAGIITERDVLGFWMKFSDPAFVMRPVKSVMSHPVTTLETVSHERAARLMLEHNFRHIPVTHPDGSPQGILSVRDVIRYYVNGQSKEVRETRGVVPSRLSGDKPLAIHTVGNCTEIRTRLMSISTVAHRIERYATITALLTMLQEDFERKAPRSMYAIDLDELGTADIQGALKSLLDKPAAVFRTLPVIITWSAHHLTNETLVWIHQSARKLGFHAMEKPPPAIALALALA